MKNILITGTNGFIGRHLASFFSNHGWQVTGIGYGKFTAQEQSRWGIHDWHSGAISSVALSRLIKTYPDLIIHCAGGSSVGQSWKEPAADFRNTVDTTSVLLRCMQKQHLACRLIFISSAAVYGETRHNITENTGLNPVSPYGKHKKIAEELCIAYANKFNLQVAIIRLFSVYGEGLRKQLLWEALRKKDSEDFEFFGTGHEKRDWIHIDDVVRLLYKIGVTKKLRYQIINGATGNSLTVNQALKYLFKCCGKTKNPEFSGLIKAGDPPSYIASISRALRLGWRPQVKWRDGFKRYVRWYEGLKYE